MTYRDWRNQYTLGTISADHETITQAAYNAGWKDGYKRKAEWVGLTDDELLKTYGWQFESYGQSDRSSSLGQSIVDEAKQEIIDGLRKVEAALKEKNT